EIGRAKARQFLSPARPIAGNSMYPGQVLTKAGIVVDDDGDGYAAAAGCLQFREMVVETAIAGEATHCPSAPWALFPCLLHHSPAHRPTRHQKAAAASRNLKH